MATGDRIDIVRPKDMFPEIGIYEPAQSTAVGGLRGFGLPKNAVAGYEFTTRIPTNGTPLATGLTFQIATADDPLDPSVGKVFRLGVTVKRVVSATDDLSQTSAATEQTVDVTSAATAGIVTLSSLAIANANLDSAAAGDLILVRIRRIGTAAADTHTGRPVLLGVTVSDT